MKGDFTRNTFNPANQFTRVLQQQGRVQLDADWNEQTSILLHYLWALATDLIGPFGGPAGGFKIIGLSDGNSPDFKIGNGRYYVAGRLCENDTIDTLLDVAAARDAARDVAQSASGTDAGAAAGEARTKANNYTAEPARSAADTVARAAEAAAAQPGATADTVQQAAVDAVAGAVADAMADLRYTLQTPPPAFELKGDGGYLVYLDVWERHVSYLETDSPIREVALGGPDTATRAQLVWQVRVSDTFIEISDNNGQEEISVIDVSPSLTPQAVRDRWQAWVRYRNGNLNERGRLQAKLGEVQNDTVACVVPPGSRYRGLENQLYRVEIHQASDNEEGMQPTFKFSRENGSAVFPLDRVVKDKTVWLKHLGRDDRFGLQRGDWVEVIDDNYAAQNRAGALLKVDEIDPLDRVVTLSDSPVDVGTNLDLHPYLRRWDHREGNVAEGGLELEKGAALLGPGKWLKLEEGIEVCFQSDGIYHTGDYWLIPARTATGDIEWPDGNELVPPHGTAHFYAPLAIVKFDGNDLPAKNIRDCRSVFSPLAQLIP